jgi:multiple sugar transport system permease protein
MTSSVQAPTAPAGEAAIEQPKRGFPWGIVGSYASIVIILIWCLTPFYYMTIMAFRDPDYALDPSLVPSHLTLSNFKYAFNTTNNHFGRSLVNGVIIGVAVTVLGMAFGIFAFGHFADRVGRRPALLVPHRRVQYHQIDVHCNSVGLLSLTVE